MEELDRKNNVINSKIEEELYFAVKAAAEAEYNTENNLDINKKHSTKLIFKDRKKAATMISRLIEDFSKEYNVDKEIVKNYLLKLIEKDLNSDNIFKEQYISVQEMVSLDEEER